jgi:ATP-dependent helicase Lhr and Lhr-like helicase
MSYELLSEPIRRYIRDKRWEQLRPIQAAAIAKITASTTNYILASRTASGKTEAAFLPILSKTNFDEPGVQVLYISPLIALINDQFYRIEELCKYLDVPVTKWHGEANKTLKEKILKNPMGIILITPESLEAMFVNKPYNIKKLFSNLKYVVIDEIHSFIGSDRGTHLKSILARLQNLNVVPFSIVGLSATIGDYQEAKKFTGNDSNTIVLLDKSSKEINASFRYFENQTDELSIDLLKNLYTETKDNKVLIFPNSRGRAEEVAVKLKKIADRVKGHANYFSHHSSVDKEVREYVEHFAKSNTRQNFCISCTSTLELGIDIGSVDEVVQIDATYSIASLIQRVGRSGRKDGATSNLFLYATNPWSLLQSLACWLLYKEGFIEPPQINNKPYDILLHQALSIVKGHSGINLKELMDQLKVNYAFKQIGVSEIEEILNHLIKKDLLEKIQQEVIIGIEGEKIVNHRDFYSVFKTDQNFKVVNAGNTIGDIPYSPQIIEGERILLAAKIWKIKFVDFESKKIEVIPAPDGKKPTFYGGGAAVHDRIRQKMMNLLFIKDIYDILDESSEKELEKMRKEFSVYEIKDTAIERPVLIREHSLELYTFSGTKTNRTLSLLFNYVNLEHSWNDSNCLFEINGTTKQEFCDKWALLADSLADVDSIVNDALESNPTLLDFSKWGALLPVSFQISLLKEKFYDFVSMERFIKSTQITYNK